MCSVDVCCVSFTYFFFISSDLTLNRHVVQKKRRNSPPLVPGPRRQPQHQPRPNPGEHIWRLVVRWNIRGCPRASSQKCQPCDYWHSPWARRQPPEQPGHSQCTAPGDSRGRDWDARAFGKTWYWCQSTCIRHTRLSLGRKASKYCCWDGQIRADPMVARAWGWSNSDGSDGDFSQWQRAAYWRRWRDALLADAYHKKHQALSEGKPNGNAYLVNCNEETLIDSITWQPFGGTTDWKGFDIADFHWNSMEITCWSLAINSLCTSVVGTDYYFVFNLTTIK